MHTHQAMQGDVRGADQRDRANEPEHRSDRGLEVVPRIFPADTLRGALRRYLAEIDLRLVPGQCGSGTNTSGQGGLPRATHVVVVVGWVPGRVANGCGKEPKPGAVQT